MQGVGQAAASDSGTAWQARWAASAIGLGALGGGATFVHGWASRVRHDPASRVARPAVEPLAHACAAWISPALHTKRLTMRAPEALLQ